MRYASFAPNLWIGCCEPKLPFPTGALSRKGRYATPERRAENAESQRQERHPMRYQMLAMPATWTFCPTRRQLTPAYRAVLRICVIGRCTIGFLAVQMCLYTLSAKDPESLPTTLVLASKLTNSNKTAHARYICSQPSQASRQAHRPERDDSRGSV